MKMNPQQDCAGASFKAMMAMLACALRFEYIKRESQKTLSLFILLIR